MQGQSSGMDGSIVAFEVGFLEQGDIDIVRGEDL